MTHRILSTLILFALILSLVGSAQAQVPAAGDETALVAVEISASGDLERFAATGLPAYARLQGRQPQDYLLAGADPAGQSRLSREGLSYHILDANLGGARSARYYLAYAAPGRQIVWSDYGQLLLDDGVQVLLRSDAVQAERLAQTGAELRQLTFDPKPLRTAAPPLNFPEDVVPDPQIEDMIFAVDSATVDEYTAGLTGDEPVWVDGDWYTITTRYTYSGIPIQKATHWTGQHFADLGLDVEYHQWQGETNPNVIGERTGSVNPDDIFIIGGHLDDVQGTDGADDNGSGSVATMIAADIATQYEWGCTLRFALWTGEEQGLNGSYAYAQRSYQQGENIVGYLNLDMISWNTPNSSPDIDLIYNPNMPPTQELAQLFADVVAAYNLQLIPQLITSLGGGSDHQSFWDFDYTAILGIEDQGDFNPYYHGPGDTRAHQNLFYYTQFVKAALGTFAHMTNCLLPSEPEYNVELSGNDAQTGIPGETISYSLSVTNTGDLTDTYTVGLGSSIFPAAADMAEVGPLTAGESGDFHVLVTIPEQALPGETDAVEVSITSQEDNSKWDSATLTTTVGGSYGVLLGSAKTEGNGAAGSTVTYTVSLTNSGSLQDTLLLTYYNVDPGWTVQLAQDSFDLAGGESVETSFQVLIPPDAVLGDWDAFMLRATSSHDPAQWAELQFTTAVGEDCTPVGSVDFVWSPFEPEVGDEMTFLASATGTAPISYAWDFGDGDTASGEQVLHFYDTGGVYPVTLTASNACGEQSISRSVSIAPFMQLYLPVISNAQP